MCSKNKGADQLRVYRASDLCLLFLQKASFLMMRHDPCGKNMLALFALGLL